MLTQVLFKIDSEIKKSAQKKAEKMGLTLSDILRMAIHEFAEGKFEPRLVRAEHLSESTKKILLGKLTDSVDLADEMV